MKAPDELLVSILEHFPLQVMASLRCAWRKRWFKNAKFQGIGHNSAPAPRPFGRPSSPSRPPIPQPHPAASCPHPPPPPADPPPRALPDAPLPAPRPPSTPALRPLTTSCFPTSPTQSYFRKHHGLQSYIARAVARAMAAASHFRNSGGVRPPTGGKV